MRGLLFMFLNQFVFSLLFQSYKVKDPELQIGTLLEAVVGRIATKDFVKYK